MKKIKMTEESYKNLKNKIINEIKYGTMDNAFRRSDELFGQLSFKFESFYNSLRDTLNDNDNPYLDKIYELSSQIKDIFKNKESQQYKFNDEISDIDVNKFYDSDDAENNEIDDFELSYLKNKYKK